MPVYEKCKVFTCNHTCNLPVNIDSVAQILAQSHFEPVSSFLALEATEPVSELVTQMAVQLINFSQKTLKSWKSFTDIPMLCCTDMPNIFKRHQIKAFVKLRHGSFKNNYFSSFRYTWTLFCLYILSPYDISSLENLFLWYI